MESLTMSSPTTVSTLENSASQDVTPEQDTRVFQSLTNAPYASRIKEVRAAIVKSKVDVKAETEQNGSYFVGNIQPKAVHKINKHNSSTNHVKRPMSNNRVGKHNPVHKSMNSIPPKSQLPQGHLNHTKSDEGTNNSGRGANTTAVPSQAKTSKPPSEQRGMKQAHKSPPLRLLDKKPEKHLPYDPAVVKSYMEQQREVRRLKEKKELEERKLEADRKRKQLQQLEHTRKDLISKSKISPKQIESKDEQHVSLATKIYRARKAKSPSGSQRRLPATKSHSQESSKHNVLGKRADSGTNHEKQSGATETRSDIGEAEVRTTMLLQEFENIVHRECLKLKTSQSKTEVTSSTSRQKVDKASGTTISLFGANDNQATPLRSKSALDVHGRKSMQDGTLSESQVTESEMAAAATIIQAAFRGYRIRKVWREVNEQRNRKPSRRISFYRARSSHSDTARRRLPMMSPVHSPVRSSVKTSRSLSAGRERSAFGVSLEFAPYIPPPPTTAIYPASPNTTASGGAVDLPFHPVSIPSRQPIATGSRRSSSRFDEPFPREAIKQLALHSPSLGASPAGSDHFLRRDLVNPVVNMAQVPAISDLINPQVPTFSMVLKEKVRILQEMQEATVRKSEVSNAHTPVKHKTAPYKYYDSDSTDHASIVMSSAPNHVNSSSEVTITDDYIGPNEEAMQLAYNLRKSQRLALETDAGERPSDSETDPESSVTLQSSISFNTAMDTGDELKYCKKGEKPDLNLNRRRVSLQDFKRKVNEQKHEVLEHAVHTSLHELKKHEKQNEELVRKSLTQREYLEKTLVELQGEVAAVNEQVRTKVDTQTQFIASPNAMLEYVKCQTESLKATAAVQQLLVDLRLSTQEESRRQETVNIATAVFAAVEEAKKIGQPHSHPPERVFVKVQEVQTTDSLAQNGSTPSYTEDEFSSSSPKDTQVQSKLEQDAEVLVKAKDEVVPLESSHEEADSKLDSEKIEEEKKTSGASSENLQPIIPKVEEVQPITDSFIQDDSISANDRDKNSGASREHSYIQSKLQAVESEKTGVEFDLDPSISEAMSNHSNHEAIEEEKDITPLTQGLTSDDGSPLNSSWDSCDLPVAEVQEVTESPKDELISHFESPIDEAISTVQTDTVEGEEKKSSLIQVETMGSQSCDNDRSESFDSSHTQDQVDANYSSKIDLMASDVESCNDEEKSKLESEKTEDENQASESASPKSLPQIASELEEVQTHSLNDSVSSYEQDEFLDTSQEDSQSQNHKTEESLEIEPGFDEAELSNDETTSKSDAQKIESEDKEIGTVALNEFSTSNAECDEVLDISSEQAELAKYGAFELDSAPRRKWYVRPRDLVDHVLVSENIKEDRSWTDYREEEVLVKESLVDTIAKRVLRETLKIVSKFHE